MISKKRLDGLSARTRVILCAVAVCLIAATIMLVYQLGRRVETVEQEAVRGDLTGRFEERPKVEWNGATYALKDNLTTLLLLGVDKQEGVESSGFREGGQADFLHLLVLDHERKTVTQLQIDRDTMAEIVVLGVLGNETGTREAQICLSHGFGGTEEKSCEYTVYAVENLLGGVGVDFYLSVNINAIGALNGALGGVTVTLEDDFSEYDASMTPGATLKLTDEQAELFVRSRMQVGDGTNEARMSRQKAYMQGAMNALRERIGAEKDYVGVLYDALTEIMTTNMRRGRLINEVNRAYGYTILPIQTPAGAHAVGDDGFMEFHADNEALITWVVETFYDPLEQGDTVA